MEIEFLKEKVNIQESLPLIIEKIFTICKTDPNFTLKDELEIVENKKKALVQKIDRQNILIEKAEEVIKEYDKRNTMMKDANLSKQEELLEQLGSEL